MAATTGTCTQFNSTYGDVVALTDSQGNIVVTFTYDLWGAPQELAPGLDFQVHCPEFLI